MVPDRLEHLPPPLPTRSASPRGRNLTSSVPSKKPVAVAEKSLPVAYDVLKSILTVEHGYVPLSAATDSSFSLPLAKFFIKRTVVTTSDVAVSLTPRTGRPCTEEEWNGLALREVREGKETSGLAEYSASKTFSERGGDGF